MLSEVCFLPQEQLSDTFGTAAVNKSDVQHATLMQSRTFQVSVTCFVALLSKNKN